MLAMRYGIAFANTMGFATGILILPQRNPVVLAKEVATQGIRVNAVRLGVFYTELHATGGEPGRVDRVKTTVPLQRGGQPEEAAAAILWLLEDDASYVTGTLLDVTGGR